MKAWFSLASCQFFPHVSHFSDLFKRKLQPVENSLKQQGKKTFNSCLVPGQGAKFSHWIKSIFLLLSILPTAVVKAAYKHIDLSSITWSHLDSHGCQPWEIGPGPGLVAMGLTLSSQGLSRQVSFLFYSCAGFISIKIMTFKIFGNCSLSCPPSNFKPS